MQENENLMQPPHEQDTTQEQVVENQYIGEPESTTPPPLNQSAASTGTAIQAPQDSRQDRNWREMRRKNREMEERFIRLEEALLNQSKPQPVSDPNDDTELPSVGHIKELKNEIGEVKKQIQYQQSVSTARELDRELEKKFTDIKQVLTEDNKEELLRRKPFYASLLSSPDDTPEAYYNKYATLYDAMKQEGIGTSKSTSQNYQREKERIQENKQRPGSPSSVSPRYGRTPLSQIDQYISGPNTDESLDAIWKHMNERIENS